MTLFVKLFLLDAVKKTSATDMHLKKLLFLLFMIDNTLINIQYLTVQTTKHGIFVSDASKKVMIYHIVLYLYTVGAISVNSR